MTQYRFRGIFLLLLMGHATACAIWQVPVPAVSQMGESKSDRSLALADYIESEQPNKIRITLEDGSQILLHAPEVEGDVVVSSGTKAVIAIADIVKLEVQELSENEKNEQYWILAWSAAALGLIFFGGLFLGLQQGWISII